MILYVNQRKHQNFYGFRKFTHIIFQKKLGSFGDFVILKPIRINCTSSRTTG